MIKFLTILIFLISCSATKPVVDDDRNSNTYVPYSVNLKTKTEIGVVMYKVQKSTNKKSWTIIPNSSILPTLRPDSNVYIFNLPNTKTGYYYKWIAVMINGKSYATDSIYIATTSK